MNPRPALASLLHLIEQHEDERRRIARALHDGAAQGVAVIALELAALEERAAADPAAAAAFARCRELAGEITASIRQACSVLHPPLLDEAGLEGALRAHVAGLARDGGAAVQLAIPVRLPRLSRTLESAALHVVRAALAALGADRRASRLQVTMGRAPRGLSIDVIADSARPAGGARRGRTQTAGDVLAAARERVRHLGGTLRIERAPGSTRIRVQLPLVRPRTRRAGGRP